MIQDDDHLETSNNDDRNRSSRDNRSNKKSNDISIYDDLDDYRPSRSRRGDDRPSSSKHRNRDYFDKPSEQEERDAGVITGKLYYQSKIEGFFLILDFY